VFVATDMRNDDQIAIKKMTLSAQNMKMLVTEIGIMKDSGHESIVAYYDSYIVDDKIWVSGMDPPNIIASSPTITNCLMDAAIYYFRL
jgi:serine/threonine protein kinase